MRRTSPYRDFLAGITLITVLACLCHFVASCLRAAPAPLPRPGKEAGRARQVLARDLVGEWLLMWGGGKWKLSLSARGDYVSTAPGGSLWTGRWSLTAPGPLFVAEALLDENGCRGSEVRWCVTWERDKDGRFDLHHLTGTVLRPDGTISTAISLRREKK